MAVSAVATVIALGAAVGPAHASGDPPAESETDAWDDGSEEVGWGDEGADGGGDEADGDDDWGDDGWGADASGSGDGFGGWGDDGGAVRGPAEPPHPPAPDLPFKVSLSGLLRSDLALWVERFEDNPFAKWRQSVDVEARVRHEIFRVLAQVHFEYDAAYLHEMGSYDQATLDEYWWFIDTREVYASFSLGPVEIAVGRQIVPWGVGELLSPLDVTAPKDTREPGQTDLEDARLPVWSTRIGLYVGDHMLEALVHHEAWWGYRSPPNGPYSPLEAIFAESIAGTAFEPLFDGRSFYFDDVQDRLDPANTQAFLRWSYAGPGLDLAVYAGTLLDAQGTFVVDDAGLMPMVLDPARPDLPLTLDHRRYYVVGTSGVVPEGDWLLRWEVAADLARDLNVSTGGFDLTALGTETVFMVNAMAGVTYGGLPDTTLALEVSKPTLVERPAGLLFPLDALSIGFRATVTLLRETLTLNAAVIGQVWWEDVDGGQLFGSMLARADLMYEVADGMKVGGGFVSYVPSDRLNPFKGLDRHDRVFLKWRWDWQL